MNWENELKQVLKDHDGTFGHNTEVDIRRYLRKIEKMCVAFYEHAGLGIDVIDEYTIQITLPKIIKCRENILFQILTTSPMPSECRYNKKKDQITIEWHY